jgi:hypothetical protein
MISVTDEATGETVQMTRKEALKQEKQRILQF